MLCSHRPARVGLKNDAEDLWAIFEFLMPGFLGDRTGFRKKFKTKRGAVMDPEQV